MSHTQKPTEATNTDDINIDIVTPPPGISKDMGDLEKPNKKRKAAGDINKNKKANPSKFRRFTPKTSKGRKRNMNMHVYRGNIRATPGGLGKDKVVKVSTTSGNKYVSKARRAIAQNHRWIQAVKLARSSFTSEELMAMSPTGKSLFVPVKKGGELYKRSRKVYDDLQEKWKRAVAKATEGESSDTIKQSMTSKGNVKYKTKLYANAMALYKASVN